MLCLCVILYFCYGICEYDEFVFDKERKGCIMGGSVVCNVSFVVF